MFTDGNNIVSYKFIKLKLSINKEEYIIGGRGCVLRHIFFMKKTKILIILEIYRIILPPTLRFYIKFFTKTLGHFYNVQLMIGFFLQIYFRGFIALFFFLPLCDSCEIFWNESFHLHCLIQRVFKCQPHYYIYQQSWKIFWFIIFNGDNC